MLINKIRNVGVGALAVSSVYNDVLYTCVGSCVAVSLYDQKQKIAGMVHIVLPGKRNNSRSGDRNAFYADTGISLLISEMEVAGASIDRMKACVVGGASLNAQTGGGIGLDNVEKALSILKTNKIPVLRNETGGKSGRTLQIEINTGELLINETSPIISSKLKVKDSRSEQNCSLTKLKLNFSNLHIDKKVKEELFSEIHKDIIDWDIVIKTIKKNFVIALTILKLCNSSYYGMPWKIDSFSTALSLLGVNRFRSICVVAASAKPVISGISDNWLDLKSLSRYSLACSIASRRTAEHLSLDRERIELISSAAFFYPIYYVTFLFSNVDMNTITNGLDFNDVTIDKQLLHLCRTLLTHWCFPEMFIDTLVPFIKSDEKRNEIDKYEIVRISSAICSILGIRMAKKLNDFETSIQAFELLKSASIDDVLIAEIILEFRSAGLVQ